MINGNTNESWTIKTCGDELLNFIIFTGCMYKLIDDENFDESNTIWPTNLLNLDFENLTTNNLKSQWKLWFNSVTEKRCSYINFNEMSTLVDEIYNTSDFLELEYIELRECCKKSYPYFIEWWEMQAGGKVLFLFMKLWEKTNFAIILRN